jgi:hypothetical protein
MRTPRGPVANIAAVNLIPVPWRSGMLDDVEGAFDGCLEPVSDS